jgi:flagellin
MQIYTTTYSMAGQAIQGINRAQDQIEKSMNRLSTGIKLSSGADDAAGLAMATRLNAQVQSLSIATNNASSALSLLETADTALDEVSDMINRIRELAVQASGDALSATDRTNIVNEAAQLESEIESIAANTSFNNDLLLAGSFTGRQIQTGANAGETLSISIASSAPSALGSYTSTGPTRAALAAAQTAASNSTADGNDVVLTANGATTTVDVADADSAKTVAAKVNAVAHTTQVNADAQTYALLFSTNASNANYTISINGNATSAFAISSSNVTDAVAKINLISATTGITASATTANQVLLHDADGDDITIENAGAGGDLDVQAVQSDGATTQGSEVSLGVGGSTNNDATRVIGTLRLYSDSAFSISQSGDANTGYATTGTPSLSALSAIDLSSANSASSALAVIDGATNQISTIRGNIGALESRLDFSSSLLTRQIENFTLARSSIEDTDFAFESAALARAMVSQQINTALLAQANAGASLVMKLLNDAA